MKVQNNFDNKTCGNNFFVQGLLKAIIWNEVSCVDFFFLLFVTYKCTFFFKIVIVTFKSMTYVCKRYCKYARTMDPS